MVLRPVEIKYEAYLWYTATPSAHEGSPLLDAADLLPGDYGCFYTDPVHATRPGSNPLLMCTRVLSLKDEERQVLSNDASVYNEILSESQTVIAPIWEQYRKQHGNKPDPEVDLHPLPLLGLYHRQPLKAMMPTREKSATYTPMPQFIVEKYLPGFAKSPPISIKIEDLWKTDVKCVFTGATDDSDPQGNRSVDIHWIFAPWFTHLLLPFGYRPYDSESDPKFTSDGNVLPMRDDVYELWLENVFSVDVDDDYRIRIFDRAAADLGLPDKLVNSDKRWDIFFREHMRYTITVAFFGGDLYIEQQRPGMEALMDAARRGDFSDSEKWQTALGREIMQGVLAGELRGGDDDIEEDE